MKVYKIKQVGQVRYGICTEGDSQYLDQRVVSNNGGPWMLAGKALPEEVAAAKKEAAGGLFEKLFGGGFK